MVVTFDYFQDSQRIPYFAAKKARSFGGAACATSCQVEIFSSARNSTGFTHFITAYQDQPDPVFGRRLERRMNIAEHRPQVRF
jgi:hypothetical protein